MDILKLVEMNNNILTWKTAKSNGISFSTINRLLNQKKIKRIDRGVYRTQRIHTPIDNMFLLQNRYPKCIFSFYTAAYLYNIGDYIPESMHVTIPHGYKLNYNVTKLRIHTVSNADIYNLGIKTIKNNFNNTIKVYDIEKTICDLIKYQSKLDININNKVFREYFLDYHIDYEKLYRYAKIMKIYNKVFAIKELLNE